MTLQKRTFAPSIVAPKKSTFSRLSDPCALTVALTLASVAAPLIVLCAIVALQAVGG
ncbi:MAG: hypothetical protein ACM31O_03505 [Bacteroidota bacterium]